MKYRIALHYSDEGYSVSIENIKIAISEYSTVVEEQLKGKEIREIEVS